MLFTHPYFLIREFFLCMTRMLEEKLREFIFHKHDRQSNKNFIGTRNPSMVAPRVCTEKCF